MRKTLYNISCIDYLTTVLLHELYRKYIYRRWKLIDWGVLPQQEWEELRRK